MEKNNSGNATRRAEGRQTQVREDLAKKVTFVQSPEGGEGARHAGTREGAFQGEEQVQRPCGHILLDMFKKQQEDRCGVARNVGVWRGLTLLRA